MGGEERAYDGGKKVKGRKRHILVDTHREGFVLRAKVHSAKVMDFERGSRRYCSGQIRNFPASLTYGWRRATEERTRARTECARPSGGAWSSSRPTKARPPKKCSDEVGEGIGQGGRGRRVAQTVAPQRLCGVAEEVGGGAHDRLDRAAKEDELMDYEQLCASGEAFVYAAMIRLMTRRIARV